MLRTKALRNFDFFGASDLGLIRGNNEDAFVQLDTINGHVFVVCDGMGGHQAGEVASAIAVETCRQFFSREYYSKPRKALDKCMREANFNIWEQAKTNPEMLGMGTTIVLVLIRDNQFFFGHVGDSRLYMYSQNTLKQLTKDHSYVQKLIDKGQITIDEAETHPRKHELTKALGIAKDIDPFVFPKKLDPKQSDVFLMCTDGLNGMLSDLDIKDVMSNQKLTPKTMTEQFIDLAISNGGMDNVTALVIHYYPDSDDSEDPIARVIKPEKKLLAQQKNMILLLFLSLMSIFIAVFYLKPETKPGICPAHTHFYKPRQIAIVIKSDKTARQISRQFHVEIKTLKALNDTDNNATQKKIVPVQNVLVADFYTDPALIEWVYGVDFESIAQANEINDFRIKTRQRIIIPKQRD